MCAGSRISDTNLSNHGHGHHEGSLFHGQYVLSVLAEIKEEPHHFCGKPSRQSTRKNTPKPMALREKSTESGGPAYQRDDGGTAVGLQAVVGGTRVPEAKARRLAHAPGLQQAGGSDGIG